MFHSKEKTCIIKIKKGNQKAFKQLYDDYSSYALRTAFAMTKNSADASDVVQETFIRIYRNIETFDVEKPFRPWFYQILMNECRRLIKKQNNQATQVESEEILDAIQDSTESGPRNAKILDALDHLTEEERTLIILKYVDRFTEIELAETMGLNVNTLKSRLLRARKRLKEIYILEVTPHDEK